ncbi:Phage portal protein, lambda family [Thalassoglobus neptunius]|uniref:Phage portal protein, lambda family n=1 Tax=Thalassoglobus neptunius TaxID=1938619 RepID=A0A5C5X2S3_9PLAN|nr:phage portal protein [Thalassoglobus neptunius]TWT57246.1 Phage portal protein, lambda family [Thalassoglobus neptunius]
MISNLIDRFAKAVSPKWASGRELDRRRGKFQMEMLEQAEVRMKRTWDGADTDRVRGSSWMTRNLSTVSALEEDLQSLRDRSEDLFHNDAYVASAVNARVDNVIGRGIRFQSRIKPFGDVISENDSDALNRHIEQMMMEWARAENFNSKQRELERSIAIYGEAIAILSHTSRMGITRTLTVMSPKRLQTPHTLIHDPLVRLGIRFSDESYTTPVEYYFRRVDEHDTHLVSEQFFAVPAERVLHVFEKLTPGQIRGVPWVSPVLNSLKDIKDLKEAKLIAEQVACCTVAFIHTENPYERALGAASSTNSAGQRIEELYPAHVEYLKSDEKVTFVDPNRPGSGMEAYIDGELRGVAGALRIPFELLTKKFSNSFAGGRLALADGKLSFQWWQKQIIDGLLTPLYLAMLDDMVMFQQVGIHPSAWRVWKERYRQHAWIPPGWPYAVNPQQENNADQIAIDGGFGTLTKALSDRGEDVEETMDTRKRERLYQLECDAAVEERRQQLATKLQDPAFGSPDSVSPETETEEVEEELEEEVIDG